MSTLIILKSFITRLQIMDAAAVSPVAEKSVHAVLTRNLTFPKVKTSFSITWTWAAAAARIFSIVRSRWPL
ncbi:hypothetical protein D3C79_937930 [compost metagenome]